MISGTYETVPGPRGMPLVGSLPDLARDPVGLFLSATRQYGDVVRFDLGPRRAHLVTHPDAIAHVLQGNHRNYGKQTRGVAKLREILGQGLLTNDGSFWLEQRRLMQPAFERQRIAGFAALMTRLAGAMLDGWEQRSGGRPFDLHAEMMAVTLAIVSEAMFGTDVTGAARDVGKAVDVAMHVTMRRVARAFNLPARWPTPENRRFGRAVATLDAIVADMIAARRRDDSRHDDLLAMLVALTDADTGERMSDAQLRDEVMTVFLAGHETTASALTFTCYLLARHPEVAARVREEVERVVGDRVPAADDARALTYTTMVVRESMRLYPPGWLFARNLIGDDTVGGFKLPAGSWVMISSFVTHRRPDFWDEPEAFWPERFEPEQVERRHKFAYFPFGGGPRLCIGQPMALLELQLIIAMVAQRFDLTLPAGEELRLDPLVTLRPRGGVRMVARSRQRG